MLATVGKGRGSDQNSEEQIWMAGSCGQVGRDTVLGYLIQKIRAIIISSLQNWELHEKLHKVLRTVSATKRSPQNVSCYYSKNYAQITTHW